MRERSGLLAAALGIGAVLYHTGSVNQSKPGAKENAVAHAATADEHPGDWNLLQNLDAFYDLGATRPADGAVAGQIKVGGGERLKLEATFATKTRGPGQPDDWWRRKLENKFDWMIATIPDPELSEMRLNFDREINSIQNAVESAGYHFDRYWFPWRVEDPAAGAKDQQISREQEEASRRSLPGVLLFRKPKELTRDLAVFLVGETPTSGVVAKQFKNAIRFGELSTKEGQALLAGPGFSGSFASLGRLINENPRPFKVRTWTSDFNSQNEFARNHKSSVSDFSATNNSSFQSIRSFCQYLRGTWKEKGPVLLLTEEGTAFGAGVASSLESSASKPVSSKSDSPPEDVMKKVYIVKFPRGISKLRNATENKTQIPGFEQSKGAELLRRELPFTLKDDAVGSSELPHFSKEQSPVSQESVLLSIATLLKKGVLHYAGIVATDPLDLLFLSRFLRSASPNTRLFTIDSDLLFEHGSDGAEYQGILTVTNYPLFAFNQLWTRSIQKSTLQIFPSGVSESIYNAVVDLLPPDARKEPREFADPFNPSRQKPALWLTVASGNGYAPVDLLKADDNDFLQPMQPTLTKKADTEKQSNTPRWSPEYWESWGYTFFGIWCLCLLYAAAVLLARPTGSRSWAIFSVKPDEPNPFPRAYFLFLLGLCLSILVVLWLAVPYIVLRQNSAFSEASTDQYWPFTAILEMLAGVMLVVCIRLLAHREKEQRPQAVTQWVGVGCTLTIAILLFFRLQAFGQGRITQLATVLLIASVVAPIGAAQVSARRDHVREQVTGRLWRWLIGGAIVLTMTLAAVLCLVKPALFGSSISLLRLWEFFNGGSLVFGVVMAAAVVPLVDAVSGIKRNHEGKTTKLFASIRSNGYCWFAGISAVSAAFFCWTALWIHSHDSIAERFLAACRSLNLTSGVCPLTPVTLWVLALAAWSFVQLRRICYHEDRRPALPELPDDVFCPMLANVVKEIDKRITGSFFHPIYNFAAGLATLAAICLFVVRDHQTIENTWIDNAMLVLASVVVVSLLLVCMRFALIWTAFREFLQQLERHPLREIFNFLPRGFLWAPLWQGGGKKSTHVAVTRSLECVRALVNNPRTPVELVRFLKWKLPRVTSSVKQLLTYSAERKRIPAPFFHDLQKQLSEIGTAVAVELENEKWPRGSYETRLELAHTDTAKDALRLTKTEFESDEPYTIGSELLALRIVPYINYVLLQLQNLAMYLSGGFILLLAAMNIYVFRAQTISDWFLAIFFLFLGGAVVTVFSQLDRDAIFSRITRTEEGKLDRNFFFRLVSYGGIPTLALLASHVPAVAKFFFAWVKPAMEAIH